jgi:PAS domain S-box-containing protein
MTATRSHEDIGEETVSKQGGFPLSAVLARPAIDDFFELSPDAMTIADLSGRLVAANPAANQLFGYLPDELIGRDLATLFTGELDGFLSLARRAEHQRRDDRALPHRFAIEGLTKAGARFPICLTLTPLTGSMAKLMLAVMRESSACSYAPRTVASAAYRAATQEISAFHRELLVEMARGHGVSGIAAALHQRTGHQVVILDATGQVLASAGHGAGVPMPRSRLVPGPETSYHALRERHGHSWTAAACPDQTLLGRISVFDPAGDLPEEGLLALEQATSILTSELLRLRSVADVEATTWREFAAEVLEGREPDRLSSRAKLLGYDLNPTHRAIAVQTLATSRNGIEVVEQVARNLGVKTPLVATRSDRTILLVPEDLPWEQLAAALSASFGTRARIGVGRSYHVEEISRSLAEAIFALELGTAVHRDKPVTAFGDLGVWGIFVESSEPRKLRELVDEWIGALIDYDKVHGSELVKTLTTYLNESCATEATAAALYIHRNTLRYRLSKVAVITGRDFGDADQRFQLELACRAWVVLQALEAT